MGARVGITGRDTARTQAAAAEIAAASGNPAVDPFPADMSSQAEVRRLADEVLAAYPRLDVLVNYVGGFWATRRLTGVTATVLHPGVARTGFAAEDPSPSWKLFLPLIRVFLKTAQKGAATSIYLASSPEVEGVTGTYFAARKPKASSHASRDTADAARLWQISLDLVACTA